MSRAAIDAHARRIGMAVLEILPTGEQIVLRTVKQGDTGPRARRAIASDPRHPQAEVERV